MRLIKEEKIYEYIEFLKNVLEREKQLGIFANLIPSETAKTEVELTNANVEYNKLINKKKNERRTKQRDSN
jgi:endo-1,4-beta-mannosidase